MPHVIVKLYKGRSEDVKMQLAHEIVKDVSTIAGCEEKVVIKPGYNPFDKV